MTLLTIDIDFYSVIINCHDNACLLGDVSLSIFVLEIVPYQLSFHVACTWTGPVKIKAVTNLNYNGAAK